MEVVAGQDRRKLTNASHRSCCESNFHGKQVPPARASDLSAAGKTARVPWREGSKPPAPVAETSFPNRALPSRPHPPRRPARCRPRETWRERYGGRPSPHRSRREQVDRRPAPVLPVRSQSVLIDLSVIRGSTTSSPTITPRPLVIPDSNAGAGPGGQWPGRLSGARAPPAGHAAVAHPPGEPLRAASCRPIETAGFHRPPICPAPESRGCTPVCRGHCRG
jgi:hypothetical protein